MPSPIPLKLLIDKNTMSSCFDAKPSSTNSCPMVPAPAKTSCTRPRQRSAKTTRSSVLRICKSGTCPGLRRGQAKGPASGSGKSQVSIEPSSIRDGQSSGGNWSTRCNGLAACSWQSLRITPVRHARAAATWQLKTGARKPNSCVSRANIPPMRIWLARSMF